MTPNIICIDGNIGCGKSTVVKSLSENFLAIPEPVEKWSMLNDFYRDPHRFSFPFQIQVLYSYYDIHKNIREINDLVIMERSPETSKQIFSKKLFTDDPVSFGSSGMQVYSDLYDKLAYTVDYYIYIRVKNTEVLMERIKSRNRLEESSISREYITDLNRRYDEFFSLKDNVLVLDGERSVDVVYRDVLDFIKQRRNEHRVLINSST